MDPDLISQTLESLSDTDTARKRRKHIKPFKGLRGTPARGVTDMVVSVWKKAPPNLPTDSDALHHLFCTAHEDGLVAIGLAAARVPDTPDEVLDLVDRWLSMVDDHETADAIGWLMFGPALVAAGEPAARILAEHASHPRPWVRRAALMACMALLPVAVEGQPAAALRARVKEKRIQMVEAPVSDALAAVTRCFFRDKDPAVRKAHVRVLRAWAEHEPDAVEEILHGVPGGVAKVLREPVEKAIKKGRRRQA